MYGIYIYIYILNLKFEIQSQIYYRFIFSKIFENFIKFFSKLFETLKLKKINSKFKTIKHLFNQSYILIVLSHLKFEIQFQIQILPTLKS